MDIRPGHAGPALAQFVDHGGGGVDVLPLPAIFFRDGQSDQPHFGDLAEEGAVPGRRLVPFAAFLARHLLGHPARQLAADFGHVAGFGGETVHGAVVTCLPISSSANGVVW